jgi:phosphate ABC transporter phosphate-binding protein
LAYPTRTSTTRRTDTTRRRLAVTLVAVALVGAACARKDPGPTAQTSRVIESAAAGDRASLSGSGSTFVEPLLRKWIEHYQGLGPNVTIDYEGVGSGEALERFKNGEGDFFTSDVPLGEVDEATMGGSGQVLQIPWAVGAIALVYNLPDIPELRLTPDNVANMLEGRIARWDHPSIRADNPDIRLPNLGISVVHRADASGTSAVLGSFLEGFVARTWNLGEDVDMEFPVGQGVRGSQALAAAVKRTPGAFGYVQLSHARAASLQVALLGNRADRFVAPTPEAVEAAMAGSLLRPYGTTARLLYTPDAPGAYALATVSYLIYRRNGLDEAKAAALRHFAAWALTSGQQFAEPLGYHPVPRNFRVVALDALDGGD